MADYILHNGTFYTRDELMHHGVKGMKWGVRRYQNKDGSLTVAGKKRRSLSADETRHLSEKARRSKLTTEQTVEELKKLIAPSRNPNFNGKRPEEKRLLALRDEVEKYSGDWYFGKGVSKAFSDRVVKYKNDSAGKWNYDIEYKFNDDILGIVLKDLGYKDSPEARALIRPVVITD